MPKVTFNRREFMASSVVAVVLGLSERPFSQPADPTDLSIAASSRLFNFFFEISAAK